MMTTIKRPMATTTTTLMVRKTSATAGMRVHIVVQAFDMLEVFIPSDKPYSTKGDHVYFSSPFRVQGDLPTSHGTHSVLNRSRNAPRLSARNPDSKIISNSMHTNFGHCEVII